MSRTEIYIFNIGMHTANTMKFFLYEILSKQYREGYAPDFAGKLAAEVANYVFEGADITRKESDFAKGNRELIEAKAKELSKQDLLCRALTCAVYNFCYARHIESGGKIGFLFHPFLAYVRALQRHEYDVTGSLTSSGKVAPQASLPLLQLSTRGLIRPLPWTPDSKHMLESVVAFGKSAGCEIPR